MSSVAAVQADGYYWPPDHDPRRQGGLNKLHGRRQSDTVRFEMPQHAICLGCQRNIGKGVRFNASKRVVGQYHSTKIVALGMKCPSCPQRFEIRNDPANRGYEFVSGVKATEASVAAQAALRGEREHRRRMDEDALYAAQQAEEGKRRGKGAAAGLGRLLARAEAVGGDDYGANAALRRGMRARKRSRAALEAAGRARGLPMPMAPETAADAAADRAEIGRAVFRSSLARSRSKVARVAGESIFGRRGVSGGDLRGVGREPRAEPDPRPERQPEPEPEPETNPLAMYASSDDE